MVRRSKVSSMCQQCFEPFFPRIRHVNHEKRLSTFCSYKCWRLSRQGTYNDFVAQVWSKIAKCTHQHPCLECCWEWKGHCCKNYGVIFVPKPFRKGKSTTERVNRVVWEITHGPIPAGLQVLHTCDHPPCANDSHYWLGTIDDNQKDSMRKGRRPTRDKHGLRLHPEAVLRGEANPAAKLTAEDVQTIRQYGRLGYRIVHIQTLYPRAPKAISPLLRGESWRHLPEEPPRHFVDQLAMKVYRRKEPCSD